MCTDTKYALFDESLSSLLYLNYSYAVAGHTSDISVLADQLDKGGVNLQQ